MAEIHIERKERTAWPWVLLGLIILALLLWWLLGRGERDDLSVLQDTAGEIGDTARGTLGGDITPATGASSAVIAFVTFANENRARQAADTSHEYTADGIRRLARALGAIADRQPDLADTLRAGVDSMATLADRLEQDWQSATHAEHARRAFIQAANVMEQLQQRVHTGAADAVSQVRQAADAVSGSRPLLEQRAALNRFFDRSANALNAMSG